MPETNRVELSTADQALRAYLHMQDDLAATQQAIEHARQEAEQAAKRTAEAFTERLAVIERALAAQHERELQALQRSNRTMLLVVSGLAAFGFFAMLFNAWMQMRSVDRLAQVTASLQLNRNLPQRFSGLTLEEDNRAQLADDPVEQSNARFGEALGRLQKRIHDLEHLTVPVSESEHKLAPAVPVRAVNSVEAPATPEVSKEILSAVARVPLIVAKGQTLLNLDQSEAALACFEEALAIAPENIEALLKKGTALERLQRTEEAIQSYDRAIKVDSSVTTAYLYKGGAFNRLKRYPEALQCYEQALRAQQRPAGSPG